MQLERRDRMLVVGGGEDHRRRRAAGVAGEGAQHLQAVHPRHVDVHQHQLGGELAQRLQGAGPVGADAHQLELGQLAHPVGQAFAGERLVFGDQGRGSLHHDSSSFAGRTISTQKPSPGAERTLKRALPP